ncbi:AAA family ATPase [Micromonospora sp. NPDC003197]
MIVWINGAFGAGKTTVAAELCRRLSATLPPDGPRVRRFDPERVGFVLRRIQSVPTGDFQDLPSWRRWVVRVGRLLAWNGRLVVVPMSLLRSDYRAEVFDGLRDRGVPVRQVVLRVPEPVLRSRIDGDLVEAGARAWRHSHVVQALTELAGVAGREWDTYEIDNHGRTPAEVAGEIIVRLGLAGEPGPGSGPAPTRRG